jgi:hypothetical protein
LKFAVYGWRAADSSRFSPQQRRKILRTAVCFRTLGTRDESGFLVLHPVAPDENAQQAHEATFDISMLTRLVFTSAFVIIDLAID